MCLLWELHVSPLSWIMPFPSIPSLHVGFNDYVAFPDLLVSLLPFNVIPHLLIQIQL